jgi:hypothetical protein
MSSRIRVLASALVGLSGLETGATFSSEDPLFAPGTGGFDDLGYHKPTEANDGFLRHELLFRSGAILAFESTDIALSSGPVRLRHP